MLISRMGWQTIDGVCSLASNRHTDGEYDRRDPNH
jgi:hypothetical protein